MSREEIEHGDMLIRPESVCKLDGGRHRKPSVRLDIDGVLNERYESAKRSRSSYLGQLTRIYRDIDLLLKGGNPREIVPIRERLREIFEKFNKVSELCYECLPDDDRDRREEVSKLYEEQTNKVRELDRKICKWLDENSRQEQLQREMPQVADGDIRLGESASESGSNASHASITSSVVRKRAKAKQAIARLKLQQLKRRQALQQRELEVKRERELLDAQCEIEQADLELTVYEERVSGEGDVPRPAILDPCSKEPLYSTPVFHKLPEIREPLTTSTVRCDPEAGLLAPASSRLNPKASAWSPKKQMSFHSPNLAEPDENTREATTTNNDSFEKLATTLRQGFTLPRPELKKFDGNPLEYWSFMRSFDNNIERNALDESEKLTYLLQFCAGDANRVISSCVTMDPTEGYRTARRLLKERFGHPYNIASAHVKKITEGPPLRPHDTKGLLTFSDKLTNCENVLTSIGYIDEINSADNLRKIIDRLPFYMKIKWLDMADNIQESGNKPRIRHISKFVCAKARAANNPVFGTVCNYNKDKHKGASKSKAGGYNVNKGITHNTHWDEGG